MSFLKRLSFFLFGLSIGVIILIFISNKKDTRFNYMPNKRVLNDIHKKKWVFKDSNHIISKNDLRPSIETSFHALIDFKYVLHVHSTSTIANAISLNSEMRLKEIIKKDFIF